MGLIQHNQNKSQIKNVRCIIHYGKVDEKRILFILIEAELYNFMKVILGNWKMNGGHNEASALARAVAAFALPVSAEVAVFPPFTNLDIVSKELSGTKIKLGAQDCSQEPAGAFTGEISADMLKECGCTYVIIGHSERRARHGESDNIVKNKALSAIKSGLKPVICVGENLEERESGRYLQVITSQVRNSLPSLVHSDGYLIAYEPVWAIGTGKIATLPEITEVHKTIASLLYRDTSVAGNNTVKTAILYGGSVKASNAREIMSGDGVDGVLVGGASLNASEFGRIIEGAS